MEIKKLHFDDDRWSNFVLSFPHANIFHSPEMNKVFQDSGFEIFPIFATENNRVVACAFPVLVNVGGRNIRFTNRLVLYASPLSLNNEKGKEGVEMLLQEIIKTGKQRSLFVEIRNSEFHDAAGLNQWKYLAYQNYLINLSSGLDSLWTGFNKYTRNHIRKAEKKNILVREIKPEEFQQAITLLEDMYHSKKIPFLGRNIFNIAYTSLAASEKFRCIAAFLDNKMIGVRISLNYANTVYDWYGTALREFGSFYPNEALVWNTLTWATEAGYKKFDFGGGALKGEHYGPAVFKEKFNGELVEFGRHRFICNKPVFSLLEFVYNLRKK